MSGFPLPADTHIYKPMFWYLITRMQDKTKTKRIANTCFDGKAKIFGMTSNQNCTREESKSRINLGNACCHSVLNLSLPASYLKRR